MKIVIIMGGLATRMKPFTQNIPKCMIDVQGKPLILHQIEFFRNQGFKDYIFCIAHLGEKVREFFGDGQQFGLHIEYSEERDDLRGTAGCVKLAEPLLSDEEDFIVYYGDCLIGMDVNRFVSFHREKKAITSIVLRRTPIGYRGSSLITIGRDEKVETFLEKPSPEVFEGFRGREIYINCGMYALNKAVLDRIPQNVKCDFSRDVFPKIIEETSRVYGYATSDFFREIGRPEKYESLLQECKTKKKESNR